VLGEESPDKSPGGQYKIPVWVFQHSDPNTPVGEFVVVCDSSGPFIDKIQPQEFVFTVTQNGKDRSFPLKFPRFPFHSYDRHFQLIEIQQIQKITQPPDDPLLPEQEFLAIDKSANIGHEGDNLTLIINSKTTDFPITGEITLVSRTNDCWEDSGGPLPKKLENFKIDPDETNHRLIFPVKFKTWCALGHSLFHILPQQQPDAEAQVDVSYTPQNGLRRKMSFVYRIHFQPTSGQLLLAGIFGLLVGGGVRYLSRDQKNNWHRNLVEFGAAATAVIVAELVCLIGFIMHKPSQFWSIDLDPHRWLPCFMIALLASGGAAVRTWLKRAKDSISDDHGSEADTPVTPATPNPGGPS